ncbi:MAG: YggS family pyridoxal phosphate-dependent enzyme [Clostridiales bacterium]|jgi:pyridoxal phosphate enzyme (YggS family)|nr:YggS family pyridoxal phosphate-dependent enzyme [Clostridiales bacterium]
MERVSPDGSGAADRRFLMENLKRVEEAISRACADAGRPREEVTLLAVTKTVAPELINEAISLGLSEIGENRVQEFLGKRDQLHLEGVSVHLIGHLQTNKAAKIVGRVDMIQSIDSLRAAQAVAQASQRLGLTTDVLLEINIGGEEAKSGAAPEEAEELAYAVAALEGIRVRGMMTVPPVCDTERQVRAYFSRMKKLFIDIRDKKIDNTCMDVLSMGMSSDFREAILEGSTMVRVGTALFGRRAPQHP